MPSGTAISRAPWPAGQRAGKETHTGGETSGTQREPALVCHYVPADSSHARVAPLGRLEMLSKKQSQERKKLQKIQAWQGQMQTSFHVTRLSPGGPVSACLSCLSVFCSDFLIINMVVSLLLCHSRADLSYGQPQPKGNFRKHIAAHLNLTRHTSPDNFLCPE